MDIAILEEVTSDADSPLICFNNDGFSTPIAPVAQNFTIPWSADGIIICRNVPA